MTRVSPLRREEAAEFEDMFAQVEQLMGFVPNTQLAMARRPEILRTFWALARSVLSGTVSPQLKQQVAMVASTAAGCRYCQAHGASGLSNRGTQAEKIAQIWSYETSELFDDAERAALRLAHHAALVPNQATDEDFEELRCHFDEGEIVEIVAIIAVMGFLNRWNDTMATELEDHPLALAHDLLGPTGWEPGKHAAAAPASP